MKINEYIKYVITNKLIHKWSWATSILGVHSDGFTNEYIKIEDGVGYVAIDGVFVVYDNYSKDQGFILISDIVTITTDSMRSLHSDIKTTFGKFLVNYIMVEIPFSGTVPYVEGTVSANGIIKIVSNALSNDTISVSDYIKFVTACSYLEAFNKLVTPSSTAKLVVPPPGLTKFKKDLKAKYIKDHGADWESQPTIVVEYDNELKTFYSDYITGDASDGVIANSKNKGNALSKKYLTFSSTNAFGDHEHIDGSLSEGYPDDPEKLAAMFNTSRSASYSRGVETQNGGSVAKAVLRTTSSVRILPGDCGVKYGKRTKITKENSDSLLGRYIIVNKKLVKLTTANITDYLDKTVEMRSVMWCVTPKPNFCSICAGERAAGYPDGIPLIVTNISSVLTKNSLKAMHNSLISTVKLDITSIVF